MPKIIEIGHLLLKLW